MTTVDPRKSVKEFLAVFKRLIDENDLPDLDMVIAGKKGKATPPIEAEVKRLGLDGRVIFTDYVPRPQLPVLYALAAAFIFPSKYEGFGLPTVEAMSAGAPLVSSDRSCMPEIVGDGGELLDPEDWDAWYAALRRVLTDADHAAALRARGLARAERYSWARMARETAAVYEKVLGAKQLTG